MTESTVKDVTTSTNQTDALNLKRLNKDFAISVLGVPTATYHEYRLVTFIMLYCKRNGIKYEMDEFGNIYLTKGELAEGEFYPCFTAHLDTVQDKQIVFAKAGVNLPIEVEVTKEGKHKLFVKGFGLGGDDKAGIAISLSAFNHRDKLKACFFLQEEVGCNGSTKLDKNWFKDVGYVLGFDSPELNRAAYRCNGIQLMDEKFFSENGLDKLCADYGLNDFRSEPYTDVVQIRKQTDIICMNFGSGYYKQHTDGEYCILEEMDAALDMGLAIVEKLGMTEHKLKSSQVSFYTQDSDSLYFEKLNPNYVPPKPTTYYGTGRSTYPYNQDPYDDYYDDYPYGNQYQKPAKNSAATIQFEVVENVAKTYETHLKNVEEEVKKKCEALGIDYDSNFAEIFSMSITF